MDDDDDDDDDDDCFVMTVECLTKKKYLENTTTFSKSSF